MNRLKKMLKTAYSAEPERKFSFIQQLKSNPTWRKLHPISTLSVISPSAVFILSTIAVIAVGMGIIAHNFRTDNIEEPPVIPDIPPIVTVTTSLSDKPETTEVRSTEQSADRVSETVSNVVTTAKTTVFDVQQSESLFSSENVQKTEHSKTTLNIAISAKTTAFSVQQSELLFSSENSETTAVPETTVPTTSVYYSHLFRHDYTVADWINDDTVLYGYPDSNIANQIFTVYDADYIKMLTDFMKSPIIEGEITATEYTSLNGLPLTVCDVKISEVFDFHGENVLNTGDVIQIASYGGYMPVSEYIALNPESTLFADWSQKQIENTVIYEDGGNEIMQKVGDKYLFLLNADRKEINGNQVYTRLAMCDIFQFYRNGDGYICCNSATDGNIDYAQLREITDSNKYYFSEPDGDRKIMIKDNAELFSGVQYYYAVDSNGKLTYLADTSTDDGFFSFRSAEDYSITWTDSGAVIRYRTDYGQDKFETVVLDYPK